MAKVAFGKLKLTKKEELKTVIINDVEIEVKQYLSASDKLKLIENVMNMVLATEENIFFNPIKVEVIGALEIIYAYTNLTFTEKQKEDIPKLYDLLETNKVIDQIVSAIPETEYNSVINSINETINAYYSFKNSAFGIMEAITQDYSDLDFDITALQQKIADPENLALLKSVMKDLG